MKLNLPNSYDDISIGKYIELKPILDKEFNNPVERVVMLLAVLTEKKTNDIRQLKVSEVIEINKQLDFLDVGIRNDVVSDIVEVDGKMFKLVYNAKELNAGQYTSVMTHLKDIGEDGHLAYTKIHNILASISYPVELYKGKVKQKEIEPNYFKETSELFYNHFSISAAYPVAVFFSKLSKKLTTITQDYLSKKYQEEIDKAMEILSNTGDGGVRSMLSLMEILPNGDITKK